MKSINANGMLLQNYDYDFDSMGNVKSYKNDCLSSGYQSVTQQYTYDNLYQLIGATGVSGYSNYKNGAVNYNTVYNQSYTYDNIGNMLSKKSSSNALPSAFTGDLMNYEFNYTYDEDYAHRLKSVSGQYYQYDDNGNITAISDTSFDPQYAVKITRYNRDEFSINGDVSDASMFSNSIRTFGWQRNIQYDDRNMMSITDGNRDDTIYYRYSEDCQRTNKYVGEKSEVITFSDYYSMMFNNSNKYSGGQIQKSIMLGNTRLISRIDQREAATKDWKDHRTFYYLSDHLRSATLITNNEGEIYQSTEYTPYGERWMERTVEHTDYYLPYRFTGKPLDEETGYYYFGARYYDAQRSVWLTSDPAIEKFMEGSDENQGIYNHFNLNSYHYGNNNPIVYNDPDGNTPALATDLSEAFSYGFSQGMAIAGVVGFVLVGAYMIDYYINKANAVQSSTSGRENTNNNSVQNITTSYGSPSLPNPNKDDDDKDKNKTEKNEQNNINNNEKNIDYGDKNKTYNLKDTSNWPKPPTDKTVQEGNPSKLKPLNRGEKSLFDKDGGEWRIHNKDSYHSETHWDYKAPGNNASWKNIPFKVI